MRLARAAVLDWSAAGRPRTGRDSVWLGLAAREGVTARNFATRRAAEEALVALAEESLRAGEALLIGADFGFGYPAGFAARLTGAPSALAVWEWLAARLEDGPGNAHNLREVAAEANAAFPGDGPFWGNGARAEIPGLPRRKPALPPGLAEHRATERAARGAGAIPKAMWQLAGAGAVGAQSLTGLPVLHRLRRRFGEAVAVWPFEPPAAPLVLAEVYPSMLAEEVRALCRAHPGMVADEAQVRLLAQALHALSAGGALSPLLAPPADAALLAEEGWILGAGHAPALRGALAD